MKRAPSATQAPVLTLPEAEAAALLAAYGRARTILEYGSGGSTAVAAKLPGRVVFSVESDADWLAGLAAWFEADRPVASLHLHHADIGPTGKWGAPRDGKSRDRYPGYALSVWDRPDFVQPDVVLIDGRFRVGCFLATLFRSSRPVTVLWDDYAGRPVYHVVERYVRPVAWHGRMARFEVTPIPVPPADLGWIVSQFGLVK